LDQEEQMSNIPRAARSALVVMAGLVALAAASSSALAQRVPPVVGRAGGLPPASIPTTPYPGATVTVDRRFVGAQQVQRQGIRHQRQQPQTYYPVASYPAYGYGGGGGVYDTNGRPLYVGEAPAAAPTYGDFPVATPDLSGSPYVVVDGGTMIVNFGNGDRRAVPACAAVEAAGTPEGLPRTVFYRPPAYQLVLRAGQRGEVVGRPAAGARVCYGNDAYGRVALAF
jgi:hypothetical protein